MTPSARKHFDCRIATSAEAALLAAPRFRSSFEEFLSLDGGATLNFVLRAP
jgi:hypothetical protein